ncbi:MAG TPA: ComEA family DNA-binding protein [Arthrobacter sp.]|nr:ComEA family DNA-binding protein [Arthrobacter sp.]
MGRHRWGTATTEASRGLKISARRPRLRVALGAALIAAGLAVGYALVLLFSADTHRAESDVLISLPVTSSAAVAGSTGEGQDPEQAPEPEPLAEADEENVSAAPEAGPGSAAQIIVHVAGAVGRPGIVRLPASARVFEALEAAGGASENADLGSLNLAAPLTDGQQVFVSSPEHQSASGGSGAAAAPEGGAGGAENKTAAKVNLNSASLEELQSLPRVGPVLAQRIIDFREQHGSFGRPEDLDAVPGIGEVMLASLVDLVTV